MNSIKLYLFFFVYSSLVRASIVDYDGRPTSVSWIYTTPDNPINLNIETNVSKKIESEILVTGGTLTTTSIDGTIFKLEIPSQALLTKTKISIVPVINIAGMPFGKEKYAVQLEPSGLQLMKPAILTITPALEIPVENQIFFGYEKTGDALFAAAPVVNSREIKIQVLHFSGYGVTKGYAGDLEATRSRLGGIKEARLNSRLNEKLIKERQSQILGGENTDLFNDVDQAFSEYYAKVLTPRLLAANKSDATCAEGRLAQESALKLARVADLMGNHAYSLILQNMAVMPKKDLQCMKEEFEICRDKHVIHRIYPQWILNERMRLFLGLDDPSLKAAEAVYVEKCLRFDFEFDSTVSQVLAPPFYTSSAKATVPFRFNVTDEIIEGQSSIENPSFSVKFPSPQCKITEKTGVGEGKFLVLNMVIQTDKSASYDDFGFTKNLSIYYLPGTTAEYYRIACPTPTPAIETSAGFSAWTPAYEATHIKEQSSLPGGGESQGYLLKDWDIKMNGDLGYDALFAVKKWKSEFKMGGVMLQYTEEGSAKIIHKPANL